MLLAMKDEAGSNLSNEENDFMLDTSYGDDLEELTAAVMLMARLQPADDTAENVPSYDAKAVSQVHASSKVHEQVSHGKRQTIIQTTDDDQIDSNIIFDDPFVENNGGMSEHDSTAHDEYREIQMLAYNVQREAENQKRLNNELKKQKDLLQRELEMFKDRVKTFESKTIQYSTYKETCDELERELRNDKDTIDRLLEKKAFKEQEDRYLDDILDLEEKLSSHDRIVYKMAQPKMYDGDLIHNNKLVIHSTDSEETLEDAEEKLPAEQTYFSIPSTSDNGSKSKDAPSESSQGGVIYALTATADVPAVYLQQFWRTVSKVPNTKDTIKFLLDTQQFTFTVDMFRDTLHLPVETPDTPFVTPANIHTIKAFMNRVGYQGVVDKVSAFFTKNRAQPCQTMFKKKEAIQYPRFIKLIIVDLMKKFPNIPKMLEEDYHSIKDDVPLVNVYTTGNVLVRGMLIPDALLAAEIRETDDFKKYETVSKRIIIKKKKPSTPSIPPPRDDRERDKMAEATILSLTLHKTTLDAKAKENIAKVQEMLAHEEIDKLVDGDKDEESSTSAFANTVLNDTDDDTGSKLEPGSYKEHPEHVFDDDEKKKKDEEVKKEKEIVEIMKDTNVDDTSAKKNEEVVTEKEVVEELVDTVTPTIVTSSKTPSTTTRQKKSFSHKIRNLPEVLLACVDEED
ncbi:hypothetical protein Tco_0910879 [Tanacetum coccineum]|uniref:Uncharacterized protein n=1 Tax=Tanacetum coccineum TaxID=301880 RepID=A0ABQ5CV43_9ASTR